MVSAAAVLANMQVTEPPPPSHVLHEFLQQELLSGFETFQFRDAAVDIADAGHHCLGGIVGEELLPIFSASVSRLASTACW